jgi:hypothetical protein
MFVDCSTYIPGAFEDTRARFLQSPNRWLAHEVEGSLPDNGALQEVVGLGKRTRLAKKVFLRAGRAVDSTGSAYLPLRLEATGPKGLFPELDADLTIEPAGSNGTKLTLRGSYRPPLDGFGKVLDRVALHKLAERSLQGLVERLSLKLSA